MSGLPQSPVTPHSIDAPPNDNGSQAHVVGEPTTQLEEHSADSPSGSGQPPVAPQQPPMRGGGRNPLALVVVAIIAAGMLFFGFHMARRPGPEAPAILSKSTPAPDFTLESLDGQNMRLSDFRGKAVLLNFWATWCGPCKIEMPWFVDLQKEYGPQGLQIVGVAMDDSSKEDIAKFAKEMGVNYPVLLGKEAVGDEYGGVPALPETFFIGRDGKIVDKIIGLKGKGEIEDSIKKALDTTPASAPTTAASAMQPQK
jgi:thiol-disulfide isomerase/thioredoxin